MFYEIRTEHARPGRGAELARYLDETVIPLHREHGMQVVGSFTGADDTVVWIRRFEDDADRRRILDAVHQDPRCAPLAATVSALTSDPAATIRLVPTAGSALR